jgi:hypothetical protein
MISNEKNFLQTTQQLAGTESINTTRLLILNSGRADNRYSDSTTDLGWVIPRAHKRSYLQQKIILQKFHMWHTFKSVREDVELVVKATDEVLTRVPIFKGNWTESTLAGYLTSKLSLAQAPADPQQPGAARTPVVVTYDPYQLAFYFCPPIEITDESTANRYLGFREGQIPTAYISEFPPVALKGPTCINVWTNFTINNIPIQFPDMCPDQCAVRIPHLLRQQRQQRSRAFAGLRTKICTVDSTRRTGKIARVPRQSGMGSPFGIAGHCTGRVQSFDCVI